MILALLKRALQVALIVVAVSLAWYVVSRFLADGRRVIVHVLDDRPAVAKADGPLRVAAFNIAHGRGGRLGESNWFSTTRHEADVHLAEIAAHIRRESPDVVILNEVDFKATWSGGKNQALVLAKALGFPHVAELRNIDIAFPFLNFRFGNAILSRFEITDVHAITLPHVNRWEVVFAGRKDALEASILHNGQEIRIVAIHLEARGEETRVASARVLIDRIHEARTPFILLGDFNSAAKGTHRHVVTTENENAIDLLFTRGGLFTDVTKSEWKTFPSAHPDRGIDWVLTTPGLQPTNTRAIPANLSDHLMIVSDIVFSSERRSP